MGPLKRIFRLTLGKRDSVARSVRGEIAFHLEMRTREFLDAGLPPERAREAARASFGDVAAIEAECERVDLRRARTQSWSEFMLSIAQDLKYAFRTLRKSPGFALVVLVTLALGIGANTAIFSVINGVLLRRLPYEGGDRLMLIRQPSTLNQNPNVRFSPLEFADYRKQNRTFDGIVEYHNMPFSLYGRGEPQQVETGVVSWNFFQVMGVSPLLGRTFLQGEDEEGAEPVLVLSHAFWKNKLGGDPAIVGQTFEMNDRVHTVVGVLPPLPQYPDDNDVYMPVSSCPFRMNPNTRTGYGARMLQLFARARPGVTVDQAQADVKTISARLHAEHAEAYPAARGLSVNAASLRDELSREARPTFLVLLGTAGLVLLIACANVANLFLARMSRREREMAVRAALGAGRGRLLRQLLTESTVLAVLGGVLGLALAAAGMGMLKDFAGRFTTRAAEISMDGSVLGFTLLLSVVTGLAFGAMPALSAAGDLVSSLKEGSAAATVGARRMRLRALLIVSQVALAFVLLIGAGLMVRSLIKLTQVDPGFDATNVLAVDVPLNWSKYTTQNARREFFGRLFERLRAEPGVSMVAATSSVPLGGGQPYLQPVLVQDRPSAGPGDPPATAEFNSSSPEYFKLIGAPILQGRDFTAADRDSAPPVVIVNQTMARQVWGAESPLGKRISFNNGRSWAEVVGVVGDVKEFGLEADVPAQMFFAFDQFPGAGTVLLRTAGDPLSLARRVAQAVYAIDPNQPVDEVRTLEELRRNSLASPRLTTTLLTMFAVLALIITAAGLAGVIAFTVSQRTHEIGIRMALGAERGTVLGMVLRQGLAMVVVGLAIGVAGAVALSHVMSGLLFGVEATDPLTFVAVGLLLFAVALAACLIPARRATAISPMLALRGN